MGASRKIAMTKICARCEEEKLISCFNKLGRDQLQHWCRECHKENRKNRQAKFTPAYYEELAKTTKICPDCECTLRATFVNFTKNVTGTDGLHRLCNACRPKRDAGWALENQEKVLAASLRRQIAVLGMEGTYTLIDIENLYKLQDGQCCYCEERIEMEGKNKYRKDHIIPAQPREGNPQGTNWPENIALSCSSCNSMKSNMPLDEFLDKKPGRRETFYRIRNSSGR